MTIMESSEWKSTRIQRLPENRFRELTKLKISLRAKETEITELREGIPDVPPSPRLLHYLGKMALKNCLHTYPNRWGASSLLKEIERFLQTWFDVTPGNWAIIPVAGSKEAFAHISSAVLNPGDTALLPAPGYPIYSVVASYTGAKYENYTFSETGTPQLHQLRNETLEASKLLFQTSPNNPTGLLVPPEGIKETLIKCSEHNIVLCQDMAYANLVQKKDKAVSVLSIADESQLVLEVHSLSKCLSVPGWRFGFVAGNRQLIENLELSKSVFDTGIFPLIQKSARYALIHFEEFNEQPLATYQRRIQMARSILEVYGDIVNPHSKGIFVLNLVDSERGSGTAFAQLLMENFKILVMPGAAFRDPEDLHVRVSLTVHEDLLGYALPIICQQIKSYRIALHLQVC